MEQSILPNLSEDVYNTIMSYLPDKELGRTMQAHTSKAKDNYFWTQRLAHYLDVYEDQLVLPTGIEVKTLYIEVTGPLRTIDVRSELTGKDSMQSLFSKACLFAAMYLVSFLLGHPGVDPAYDNSRAIQWAADYNHIQVVELLLADGRSDPSAEKNAVLNIACSKGHTELVELLLRDKRVDPGAYNNKALREAFYRGHSDIVKLLLDSGKIDKNSLSARRIIDDRREQNLNVLDLVRQYGGGY